MRDRAGRAPRRRASLPAVSLAPDASEEGDPSRAVEWIVPVISARVNTSRAWSRHSDAVPMTMMVSTTAVMFATPPVEVIFGNSGKTPNVLLVDRAVGHINMLFPVHQWKDHNVYPCGLRRVP